MLLIEGVRVEMLGELVRRSSCLFAKILQLHWSPHLGWIGGQYTQLDMTKDIQATIIVHLLEPVYPIVAWWWKIDLDDPWFELLVNNKVKSVHLEAIGTVIHAVLDTF